EIAPGVRVIGTPGHTAGHQSVLVSVADGAEEVLIGDAAYTSVQYSGPANAKLPDGQASDRNAWAGSLERIKTVGPAAVHFCHDAAVLHGGAGTGECGRTRLADDGQVTLVHEVPERTLPLARLEPAIGQDRYRRLVAVGDQIRARLGDRTIWNVSSTAMGGGV